MPHGRPVSLVAAAHERRHAEDVVIHLDRVTVDEIAAQAAALGFVVQAAAQIPETERYLGSTVALLRAPLSE